MGPQEEVDEFKSALRDMIMQQRRRGKTYEEATAFAVRVSPHLKDLAHDVLAEIQRDAEKNRLLDRPYGALRRLTEEEARQANWYAGPQPDDEAWPRLHRNLLKKLPVAAVEGIDQASTKVVANLADPHTRWLKKRGLVVGHVQSGKTANYSAVLAKAADAGYRLVIVLAGIHNNLRRQTQQRLEWDLGTARTWVHMTTQEADFGGAIDGSALMDNNVNILCVVKKNSNRLERLRKWLNEIPEDIRARCPAIIIDDEADQATPNTRAAKNEISAINKLIRDVWALLPSGSYVGYTATPFANVFMDPNDEEELYPSDFIMDLPESDEYFGAERIFGRYVLEDAEEPDPGLNMVREVPDDEANALKPPSKAIDQVNFEPTIPGSLEAALRWFLIATAIRWARGESSHSSMLIHTTHFVNPHFAMQGEVREWLREEIDRIEAEDFDDYFDLWLEESDAVSEAATKPMPEWPEIAEQLLRVVHDVRVVVDNGSSEDRLDYNGLNVDGTPRLETVIAIGGGTLSRGLTLEGLVVSYFTRNSNSYDALLQMGRWFGYRPGYEDLPRVWMPAAMAADFEFLATVEAELRQEIRKLQIEEKTPREVGVRIRSHPGRLVITSASKMAHADEVQVSLNGVVQQTIRLIETDAGVLARNLEVTRRLVAEVFHCKAEDTNATAIFRDVGFEVVSDFLNAFTLHEGQGTLRANDVDGWVRSAVPTAKWNVAVIGRSVHSPSLGAVELGPLGRVNLINRAPLEKEKNEANIKALISQNDRLADIDPARIAGATGRNPEEIRSDLNPSEGLLLIYPISDKSTPSRTAEKSGSRRPMKAPMPVMAYAINFPEVEESGSPLSNSYYAVRPDWTPSVEEDYENLPQDTEADAIPRVPR